MGFQILLELISILRKKKEIFERQEKTIDQVRSVTISVFGRRKKEKKKKKKKKEIKGEVEEKWGGGQWLKS